MAKGFQYGMVIRIPLPTERCQGFMEIPLEIGRDEFEKLKTRIVQLLDIYEDHITHGFKTVEIGDSAEGQL